MCTKTIRTLQFYLNSKWDEGAAIISRGTKQKKKLKYDGKLNNRTVRSIQCFLNEHKKEAKLMMGPLKIKGIYNSETRQALQRYLNHNASLSGLKRSKLKGDSMETKKGVKALQNFLNGSLSL